MYTLGLALYIVSVADVIISKNIGGADIFDQNQYSITICDSVCEKGSYSLFNCTYLATCTLAIVVSA